MRVYLILSDTIYFSAGREISPGVRKDMPRMMLHIKLQDSPEQDHKTHLSKTTRLT